MSASITPDMIARCHEAFHINPVHRLARNAVAGNKIPDVAVNRQVLAETDLTFSHQIETGKITDQKSTGRCWMFAGLNTFRILAMEKMNLDTFELSQSYTMFWDKFEKSNWFLENMLATLEEDIHGRLVMWLLADPLQDGGQWDMFANLVKKYGVVPKSVMPETFNSSNSRFMNRLITLKLREYAAVLRNLHGEGQGVEALRARKTEMLEEVYRMLVINLGEPPTEFTWQYRDKDKAFHRDDAPLTPRGFYDQYIGLDLDSVASLIHCPTVDKPFNKMYTVQYLGNVVDGEIVRYLNVDLESMKAAAVAALADGVPVWHGCDVGQMMHRDAGIMDERMYEYDLVYGMQFKLDKAQRVDYGDSQMTHAMTFTGVDLVEGKPVKWQVENSWGEKCGKKGWFVMSDPWFDQYMFQILVPKKYLSSEHQALLETEPIQLKPWDPMGSLALMR